MIYAMGMYYGRALEGSAGVEKMAKKLLAFEKASRARIAKAKPIYTRHYQTSLDDYKDRSYSLCKNEAGVYI